MLKAKVGTIAPYDGNIAAVFRNQYEDEWFEDPFVKQMVKEIDKSDVVSANLIVSPVLGPITFNRLSSGVKILIMLYKMPEMTQWASNCGDNCMELLVKISKMHDITVKFSHCPGRFPEDVEVEFLDNGEIARGVKDVKNGILWRL